ncbi:hypothetical protein HPB48_023072 [Haemaphysalis longicornis]|uniref:Uncharacterized protein n=1 Tax=Haemaphysalis longicornis TaxID=44386 RepID=A0A9J6H573_HAELO|nr:hypothetical protein HPB48_023072 [Haemaphysalis longicornis]
MRKSMSEDRVQSWVCPTCTNCKSRLSEGQGAFSATELAHEDRGEPTLANVLARLDEVLRRLNDLEMKQEKQLAMCEDTGSKIEKQTEVVQEMEKALEFLSKKYDEFLLSFEAQKTELNELKSKALDLEVQLAARDSKIMQLAVDVDNLETYSRRNNLEIHGVQFTDNEDLSATLASLANKLELPVPSQYEVEAVHRLKSKPGVVPPILVRFANRTIRDLWLEKRNCLKSEKIYLNENLTLRVKRLLWLTKNPLKLKNKTTCFWWARAVEYMLGKWMVPHTFD